MLTLVLTCEHGGNEIPPLYQPLFRDEQELLQSHRGYDPGALELFNTLQDMADESFFSTTSRLLVELNRSLHHKNLFSSVTKPLRKQEKDQILRDCYILYREQVEGAIHNKVLAGNRVLHVAVHTFTPILEGKERQADIGLLYDPKREGERTFSKAWKEKLLAQDKKLLVRYNYPYLGTADGFPTYLRHKYADGQYIGIEIEVNQKFVKGTEGSRWQEVQQAVKQSLYQLLQSYRT